MKASSFLLPAYAELCCFSNFTFLRGASHAAELVERAQRLGYAALAITDECSLAGVVRAHIAAKDAGIRLIVGSYIRLNAGENLPPTAITVLPRNREGYGNLSEVITLGRMRTEKGAYLLTRADIDHPAAPYQHLQGLPDCSVILAPSYGVNGAVLDEQLAWATRVFGDRLWISLTLHGRALDDRHRDTVEVVATAHGVPVVATGEVCMHVRSRKPLQDTLTSIRVRRPVHECGYDLAPNAEQHLRSRLRLANIYPAHALAETLTIAEKCTFSLDELRYEYPHEVVPDGMTATAYLRQETYLGAHRRYPGGIPHKVQELIEHELTIIAKLKLEPYFLTVYDLVSFARRQGILCQGRGSAANSACCYALGVTSVDPARATLLFERFINEKRSEDDYPDIDIDFENNRNPNEGREAVIQYIYKKYGRNRAALAAAVTTYRPRSAIRDAGRALGIDLDIVDRIAKSHHWFDSRADLLDRFVESGLDPDMRMTQQWATLAAQLLGFPRHLSQHVGGFVISRDKLSRLCPVENAAMPDRTVIQWDKDDIEALRLMKVDVLALGMLSAIHRTLDLVAHQRGEPFEITDIPAEDPATYEMLCRADSVGVFQVESRAQISMLPRLQPRCFYDLVVQVAIVRPGPIQGGMVHPYLRRRQGKEPVTYPSAEIEGVLSRTLGVPIFQEQVMQIAMVACGFSGGEADQLRRAMGAWKRNGGLEAYRERVVGGMVARGYDPVFAAQIFSQIQGFAEYGFPESHSASFAHLVYASAWLKRHEPAAFLCGLLNSQPMGFYSPSQLVQDARRHGVVVLPVDVTISGWDSTLEGEGSATSVRLGLSNVRGMRAEAAMRIEMARAVRPFTSVSDMSARADLDRHDLQALAAANALANLSGNRRQALWDSAAAVPDKDLLRADTQQDPTPALPALTEAEEIYEDYRTTGLTLGRHPLALLRTMLSAQRFMTAEVLAAYRNGQLARAAGIVSVRQRPATANGVVFMTLEDESGTVNVIVWPSVFEKFRQEALGASLLGVYGVWQREGEVRHLVANRLADLSELLGQLDTHSRDFC